LKYFSIVFYTALLAMDTTINVICPTSIWHEFIASISRFDMSCAQAHCRGSGQNRYVEPCN